MSVKVTYEQHGDLIKIVDVETDQDLWLDAKDIPSLIQQLQGVVKK